MGRETHRRPEVPLTDEERFRLGAARQTVADLAEREPPSEALSELGYEQRMARGRALELSCGIWANVPESWMTQQVVKTADMFYDFIWRGETHENASV